MYRVGSNTIVWISSSHVFGFVKDSDFRRVPLHPDDRWAAGVVFRVGEKLFTAQHAACPFGAARSNVIWDTVGKILASLIRRFLKIGVLRYVDDLFAPEHPSTMEHASRCITRFVRLLLGPDAIADKKVEWGHSLIILGILIQPTIDGIRCRPSTEKIEKWLLMMRNALANDSMPPGDASKLAGKLNWGTAAMFKRYGKAMLRSIYDQTTRMDGKMCNELRRALRWWIEVLSFEICETCKWKQDEDEILHMFCDASGEPGHIGAVLMTNTSCLWTHTAIPDYVLSLFASRRDSQIMGLELLSIALGLNTFKSQIANRRVFIYSDNTGSEVIVFQL